MVGNKAAVVTPYGLFNYGNRLQNYAVHRTLEKVGLEPETLVIRRPYAKRLFLDSALRIGHGLGLKGDESAKYRSFRRFDRHLKKRRVSSDLALNGIEARYDVIVFGSDQIWNPYQVDMNGAEYGSFASETRKVALSASFGVDRLPKSAEAKLKGHLSDFYAISVREHAGQDIIQTAVGKTVPVLIDPTMSLNVSEWRRIASHAKLPRSNYLFVYLLGNYGAEIRERVQLYAENRKLEIVTLMDLDQSTFYSSGPDDFVGLIEGASEVISDSFHAAVFSMMFGIEFRLMRRPGRNSMASRFTTLATHFDLEFYSDHEWPWKVMHVKQESDFDNLLHSAREVYSDFAYRALLGR